MDIPAINSYFEKCISDAMKTCEETGRPRKYWYTFVQKTLIFHIEEHPGPDPVARRIFYRIVTNIRKHFPDLIDEVCIPLYGRFVEGMSYKYELHRADDFDYNRALDLCNVNGTPYVLATNDDYWQQNFPDEVFYGMHIILRKNHYDPCSHCDFDAYRRAFVQAFGLTPRKAYMMAMEGNPPELINKERYNLEEEN